jgi:hypothetical protein
LGLVKLRIKKRVAHSEEKAAGSVVTKAENSIDES